MGCQRDVTIFHVRLEAGPVATVEHFEHPGVDLVVSNFFEQINETAVRLPEDMLQFDSHHIRSLEDETAEEVRRFVVRSKQFPVFRPDDGRQLVQVANHKHLNSAEGSRVLTVAAKHVVHGVEQVRPHHADLIDHEQVKRPKQLDFVPGKTPLVVDLPHSAGKVQPHRFVLRATIGTDIREPCSAIILTPSYTPIAPGKCGSRVLRGDRYKSVVPLPLGEGAATAAG